MKYILKIILKFPIDRWNLTFTLPKEETWRLLAIQKLPLVQNIFGEKMVSQSVLEEEELFYLVVTCWSIQFPWKTLAILPAPPRIDSAQIPVLVASSFCVGQCLEKSLQTAFWLLSDRRSSCAVAHRPRESLISLTFGSTMASLCDSTSHPFTSTIIWKQLTTSAPEMEEILKSTTSLWVKPESTSAWPRLLSVASPPKLNCSSMDLLVLSVVFK